MEPEAEPLRPEFIHPDWPAPAWVHAAVTTRAGGCSAPPYASLNLAGHVGDDAQAVQRNRQALREILSLPAEPRWLTQVHGCAVANLQQAALACEADAAYADLPGRVCAVLTADCLPVFFAARDGSEVAVAHAGWRGLAAGVLERTLKSFRAAPGEVLAWLGPAIGPSAFEVGGEVREAFVAQHVACEDAFTAGRPGHWLADIYALARIHLAGAGVAFVGGGDCCTVSDPKRFYSYRRDGVTGRMASLIWIDEKQSQETA